MNKPTTYPNRSILGVEIDVLTMNEAANIILDYAASNSPSAYVTKPYVEFLDSASTNVEIRNLLNNAYLTLPDSVALQWAGLYLYGGKRTLFRLFTTLIRITTSPSSLSQIIPERFAGADFSWKLLRAAKEREIRVYLIGHPKASTLEHTAAVIKSAIPGLAIVGTFDGLRVNHEESELLTELKTLKPQLILIGIGFPKQERLMARLSTVLEHGVMVGEGGTFDYQSFGGGLKRAPAWMRTTGLEWLWRLMLQPSRFKRQLAIPRFIWKVYRSE